MERPIQPINRIITLCLNPTLQKTLLYSRIDDGRVNRTDRALTDASGKGVNVSRVLTQLAIPNIHLSHVGGSYASLFADLCQREGIETSLVDSDSEIRWCTTLVCTEAGMTTELVEEARTVGVETPRAILNRLEEIITPQDVLVISGSKAPGYPSCFYAELLGQFPGVRVIADYRGEDLVQSLSHRPWIIKPNIDEFASTFFPSETPPDPSALEEKILALDAEFDCRVILTRGREPTLYSLNQRINQCGIPQVDVLNTTGCGDSFTAGLAAALYGKKELPAAIAYGNEIAARAAATARPASLI